jgi:peptide/nickel transport system permease protein
MIEKRNPNLTWGAFIAGLMILLILYGQLWTPYDPNAMSAARSQGPSLTHLLGTDNFGRDIFSRVLVGAGATFVIAMSTVAIGAAAGTVIGALTGYFGGWVDEGLMRLNDALAAFPSILLALVILSLTGPGKYNVILALGILFIPSFARVVRTEFAAQKSLDYVRSARLMGASHFRVMFLHILPNTGKVLLRSIAIGFNNAVLAEAGMSFLGIGVSPTEASLGRMLSDSQAYLFSAPWMALGTGLAIVLLILGFALLSEGMEDA